jgi:succinate dehydrogenase/fumarate reductase flavoprotein subunit
MAKKKDDSIKIYRYYNGKIVDTITDKKLIELSPVRAENIISELQNKGCYQNKEVLYSLKSIVNSNNNTNI